MIERAPLRTKFGQREKVLFFEISPRSSSSLQLVRICGCMKKAIDEIAESSRPYVPESWPRYFEVETGRFVRVCSGIVGLLSQLSVGLGNQSGCTALLESKVERGRQQKTRSELRQRRGILPSSTHEQSLSQAIVVTVSPGVGSRMKLRCLEQSGSERNG